MAEYALGDIQGCYDTLQRLLDHLQFNERQDRLWFVGDLVNRGPDSLNVLRFIRKLPLKPRITLGNHDLHLLYLLTQQSVRKNSDDTLEDILNAPERDELIHWLRHQSLMYYDETQAIVMSHAGIPPIWNLAEALQHAKEVEIILQSDNFSDYMMHIYGNTPTHWSPLLDNFALFRLRCNYFTRMRFCDPTGGLLFDIQASPHQNTPATYFPWYEVPQRPMIQESIVFGHWSALQGKCPVGNIYALDTGCVWGGSLTALRLDNKQRFTWPGI